MNEHVKSYKGIILYLFFGICTTVVNVCVYFIWIYWLGAGTITGTIWAWIFAVIFAYITNKIFVFNSSSWKKKVVLKEATSFFMCRAATGVLDIFIMVLGVDVFHLFDIEIKIFSNVVVIVANYIASKHMIFNHND